jgi:hypothetical protein
MSFRMVLKICLKEERKVKKMVLLFVVLFILAATLIMLQVNEGPACPKPESGWKNFDAGLPVPLESVFHMIRFHADENYQLFADEIKDGINTSTYLGKLVSGENSIKYQIQAGAKIFKFDLRIFRCQNHLFFKIGEIQNEKF